jgi:site-specific DNA-adenine methylase
MLSAPFPYFGGKAKIAARVWQALGQPGHYIEPFFGSGAVLLARPDWQPNMTETVNDIDGFVCNVWRAIQFSPDETAKWCDWPVNHADLMARRKELLKNEERLLKNLVADPMWCDPVLAGYWIWAASCWIGAGLTRPNAMPHLAGKGKGVHKASLGQIPHLAHKGKGVHSSRRTAIYEWFAALSARLRNVRVVCGEWNRVCGGDWQDKTWPDVGVFFDPPYAVADRDSAVYDCDSQTVAHEVRAWCIERGARENYRIVLAGYDEHEELAAHGWTCESWKARGGYGNQARKAGTQGQTNRFRETLWFSPGCVGVAQRTLNLG